MTTVIHNCKDCAMKRVFISDTVVDEEDKKAYIVVTNEYENAEQAANPTILDTLPPAENESQKLNREMYFKAAINTRNEVRAKMAAWWMHMRAKYGEDKVPDTAKFDINSGKFYHCVDENGVARADVDFIPKKRDE